MKGFPKNIKTKQDFKNLLAIPQYREQALKDLQTIYNTKDDKAIRVVSVSEEIGDLITEEISNPVPVWRQKGFGSRKEIAKILGKK